MLMKRVGNRRDNNTQQVHGPVITRHKANSSRGGTTTAPTRRDAKMKGRERTHTLWSRAIVGVVETLATARLHSHHPPRPATTAQCTTKKKKNEEKQTQVAPGAFWNSNNNFPHRRSCTRLVTWVRLASRAYLARVANGKIKYNHNNNKGTNTS